MGPPLQEEKDNMKIYMMTDMEGISGVHRVEYTQPEASKYAEGRRLLTGDVNAAVAGCFDGGATEVVVRDGHMNGGNFLLEEMDERVVMDYNARGQWQGCLDRSFDAVMIVGQHAMAGTVDGFLDHTQSSTTWYEFSINGRAVGEIGQFACMAGAFDVPVVMVAGDRAAAEEATQLLGPIEVAAVKYGVGRSVAVCLHPKKARTLIHDAAARAMKLVPTAKPWKPKRPMEVVVRFTRSDHADEVAFRVGNVRVDARTIRCKVKDPLRLFDFMMDMRPVR